MHNWTRAAWAWGPVIVCMATIFLASAQPTMPLEGRTGLSDKSIHALAYFVLTLLAYRAAVIAPLRRSIGPRWEAFLVSVLYGAWDEVHQYFVPGRNTELLDWLADAAGALAAVLVITLVCSLTRSGGNRNGRRRERL